MRSREWRARRCGAACLGRAATSTVVKLEGAEPARSSAIGAWACASTVVVFNQRKLVIKMKSHGDSASTPAA